MERSPTTNIVFVCVESTFLLAIVVRLLCSLFSCDLPSRLWSFIKRAVAAIRIRREEDDDEVGRIVTAKMQKLMLDNFRLACHALCMFVSVGSVWMLVQIAKDKAIRKSFVTDILQMVLHGLLALVVVWPGFLNMRTVNFIYGALVLGATAYASPLVQVEPGMWFLVTNLPMVLLNVARRRASIVVPLNLLYGIVTGWSILSEGWPCSIQIFMLMTQIVFLSSFPVCAHFLEVGMASAIRKSLQAEAANELFSAASALLRSCCDVHVEISAEGVIVCPAPDLKSFLMRPPTWSLQNTRLSDLMPHEDDKTLFMKSLQAPRTSDIGLAEAIHVTIRNANNTHIKVEMLSFKFHHLDGQPRFMLGLREFCDWPAASKKKNKQRRQRAAPTGAADARDAGAEQPMTDVGGEAAMSEDSDSHSTLKSVSCDMDHVGIAPAVVLVDSTEPRLPVLGTSSGFRMRVGRLPPRSCLLDLVQQGDDFVRWLQLVQQQAAYGAEVYDASVVLSMPRGLVRAKCRVLRDTEDEMLDWEHTQLLFCDAVTCRPLSNGCAGPQPTPPVNFRGTLAVHASL